SRCTPAESCQLKSRFPHPCSVSGSYFTLIRAVPKSGLSIGPHSPLSNGLVRTQSGTKLRFKSRHARFVVLTRRDAGAMFVVNVAPEFGNPGSARSLLRLVLNEVLPLPKTSKAAPVLGSRSCHRTPSVSRNTIFRIGTNSPG